MDFRNWVLERFTPCVMVIASPEAEAMCQEKNGVTVINLLRPFGFFHHLSGECSPTIYVVLVSRLGRHTGGQPRDF